MRAAGLLPLLPLLLLPLGVSSQENADSASPGTSLSTMTTAATTEATPASTAETSPTSTASPTTDQITTASTTKTEEAATQPTVADSTTAQSSPTTTDLLESSSPSTLSPSTAVATSGTASPATMTLSHTPGQDSPSQSTTILTTTPAAQPTTSQQPSDATTTSGSSETTTAADLAVTNATSPPGAVGAVGASSPTTQPQGNQPLGHLPNTTVSTTVPRTDTSQSSKDCPVSPPPCETKQPASSSTSPVQGPTPSTSSGSAGTSVTPLTGSPSLATTSTLQNGSRDTVPGAATTTTPGADQSTHDAGSAPTKPTSASQSPDSAQPPVPASGDQAESCSSGHQHPNISYSNEFICDDQVQHTRPTIQLKEPRTCDEWRTASKNISFFESFCSTAQHVFDASRDRCTVTLMACKPRSHQWAVWVVLHHPLDSEEVLKELKEKKDKLEELGIVNITSDKMVEDMTINDEFSTPLIITIITLAGSLLLVAAIYGCHQRFSQKKDQQRLTEEMQTMENGYHDNPTLEVMETSSEMQEKKVNLNGELGDSWIVPLDTLMKEDLEEEEDTHL
ncbi:podocalyxin isoform X2 [Parus major]|uniref:podocalyxin isoform X2 n=1 Tax=Parus major TaxID=9157 RepID=UPI0007714163|nr:podocalyxin isoform X2 [Parus major]